MLYKYKCVYTKQNKWFHYYLKWKKVWKIILTCLTFVYCICISNLPNNLNKWGLNIGRRFYSVEVLFVCLFVVVGFVLVYFVLLVPLCSGFFWVQHCFLIAGVGFGFPEENLSFLDLSSFYSTCELCCDDVAFFLKGWKTFREKDWYCLCIMIYFNML